MPTISSSLVHPEVTPCTALFTSALVNPCSAALSSLARSRCRVPSTVFNVMPSAISAETLPLGPSTKTVVPSTLYFTPGGSGIGFFPMRDIAQNPYLGLRVPIAIATVPLQPEKTGLPDLAKQLAAHALAARLAASHYAPWRGQN